MSSRRLDGAEVGWRGPAFLAGQQHGDGGKGLLSLRSAQLDALHQHVIGQLDGVEDDIHAILDDSADHLTAELFATILRFVLDASRVHGLDEFDHIVDDDVLVDVDLL